MSSIAFSRRTLLGAGLVLGASGLVRPARAQTPVGLQLSWLHSVQFAGSYIAQQNGWWSDAGLQVQLMQGGPNAPVEPPVVAGTALVGISAADYAAARPPTCPASGSAWRSPIPRSFRRCAR